MKNILKNMVNRKVGNSEIVEVQKSERKRVQKPAFDCDGYRLLF